MALADCITKPLEANSYVTVDQADAWFGDRVGYPLWADQEDTTKAALLITATGWLDTLSYIGLHVYPAQTLKWPRIATDRSGRMADANSLPSQVAEATFRLAYNLISNSDPVSGDQGSGPYKRVELGDLKVEYNVSPSNPALVNSILDLYPWLTAILGDWTTSGIPNRLVTVKRG